MVKMWTFYDDFLLHKVKRYNFIHLEVDRGHKLGYYCYWSSSCRGFAFGVTFYDHKNDLKQEIIN